MPVGTAVHERTFALCNSLNYREWSGFYAVSVYETHHEHEYNAIRNAAALIDVTPLYKYMITGRDATRFVNRIIARDINKVSVDQVIYCCWCDEDGKIIDDGTITRLEENRYRWTAADPNLRWFRQNAFGFDVQIEDITEQLAALALQGPTSGKLLKSITEADIEHLKYFRKTSAMIGGVPVDISRTGYTGDLGYEIWIPWQDAVKVWDVLMEAGRRFDIHPAGMLALDVARIEAGLILADVDYVSSKKSLIASQKYTPAEVGLGKLVHYDKANFIGREALLKEKKVGPKAFAGRIGNRLERSRGIVRSRRTGAADSSYRVSRSCAGLQGQRANRQSDVDYVVAIAEAVDCSGQRSAGTFATRREVTRRDDRRSGTPQSCCDGSCAAVLQSTTQNENPCLECAPISQ